MWPSRVNQMNVNDRRRWVYEHLNDTSTIQALAELAGTSETTIRKDYIAYAKKVATSDSIVHLGLPVAQQVKLIRAGMKTVEDIRKTRFDELARIFKSRRVANTIWKRIYEFDKNKSEFDVSNPNHISNLDLPAEMYKSLINNEIYYISELTTILSTRENTLLRLRNMSKKSIQFLHKAVTEYYINSANNTDWLNSI